MKSRIVPKVDRYAAGQAARGVGRGMVGVARVAVKIASIPVWSLPRYKTARSACSMKPAVPTITGEGEKSENDSPAWRVHGATRVKKGKKVTIDRNFSSIPLMGR